MVKIKKFIISLSLPFFVTIIIPLLMILLIEKTSITRILNINIFQIISGICIIAIGFTLVSWCIKVFFKLGKGTLMPISKLETQKLVIVGPYKYIRNPMILGVINILLGESITFGSWWLFVYCLIFLILNLIYIPLFEEKGLERRFGEEFLKYKQEVHGWIPIRKLRNKSKN